MRTADANEKELKKAFEDFSKKGHPSKGGDAFVYEKVSIAYEMLMRDVKSMYQPVSKEVGYEGTPI